MTVIRRLFISGPRDVHLDARRRKVRSAIVAELQERGYRPQAFGSAEGGLGDLVGGRTRGIVNPYGGAAMLTVPARATSSWVRSNAFQRFLNAWHDRLEQRWDVFPGYSSNSATARPGISRGKGKDRVLIIRQRSAKMPADPSTSDMNVASVAAPR